MGQPQHDMSLVEFQTDLEFVVSKQVLVRESDALVDTHIQVNRGDTVMFHPWAQIWAGSGSPA